MKINIIWTLAWLLLGIAVHVHQPAVLIPDKVFLMLIHHQSHSNSKSKRNIIKNSTREEEVGPETPSLDTQHTARY
jgi:hypothetical protein